LYENGKSLFCGDAVITDANSEILCFSEKYSSDFSAARNSLSILSKLQFQTLLPGHGKPVTESASEKLKNFVR
jgi:glyoxylase-like metal-dependent hydrolase (beta-lactamase superfamily II)